MCFAVNIHVWFVKHSSFHDGLFMDKARSNTVINSFFHPIVAYCISFTSTERSMLNDFVSTKLLKR